MDVLDIALIAFAVVWTAVFIVVLALCKAAARSDAGGEQFQPAAGGRTASPPALSLLTTRR